MSDMNERERLAFLLSKMNVRDSLHIADRIVAAGFGDVAETKAKALEEAAAHFQQEAVDQTGLFGFARVSLDLLWTRAKEIRAATSGDGK